MECHLSLWLQSTASISQICCVPKASLCSRRSIGSECYLSSAVRDIASCSDRNSSYGQNKETVPPFRKRCWSDRIRSYFAKSQTCSYSEQTLHIVPIPSVCALQWFPGISAISSDCTSICRHFYPNLQRSSSLHQKNCTFGVDRQWCDQVWWANRPFAVHVDEAMTDATELEHVQLILVTNQYMLVWQFL